MATRKPPVVLYEDADEMTHSVGQPICGEPDCICNGLEYAQLIEDVKKKPLRKKMHTVLVERIYEPPLNYRNRGFTLLR
jgi:hypothetical protein